MTFTFPDDALVLSFMPHMHLRGISADTTWRIRTVRPRPCCLCPITTSIGRAATVLKSRCTSPRGASSPGSATGTTLRTTRNPDPTKEVRWGLQTWDEMQNGWMEVVWKKR